MNTISKLALAAAIAASMSACGTSTKMLKETTAAAPAMLGTASDAALEVRVDGLVVRDGPGSWSRHAYWDEYRVTLVNRGDATMTIAGVSVVDSLGVGATASAKRKTLSQETKRSIARHRKAGMDVAPGANSRAGLLMVGGSAAMVTGGAAVGAASVTASVGGSGASGAASAGAGLALGGVVLVGYGINRMVQNGRLSNAIEDRSLVLGDIAPGARRSGSAFVPITPAPTELVVTYRDDGGHAHDVIVPLPAALSQLHIKQGAAEVAEAAP